MAVPAVSVDVTRVAEASITPDTGTWGNDGGGGGVADEPDNVYQGTISQSRKVGSSLIGRSYTHGSGTDMDGTPANTAHVIMKLNMTNYNALNTRTTPGSELKVGSSSSAYHSYYLFGNDNYPPLGGWQIIAIAPAVAGYASAVGDTGSPNDSAILYWSWLGDFTSTSKSENVIIDAIDVGLGLFVVAGTALDPECTFQDFVDYDEGTVGNRYGFVTTKAGVLFVTGQLTVGQTSAATTTVTEFDDSGITLVWQNGLVATGFNRFYFDLGNFSTVITLTNCSLGSVGQVDNDGDRGYTTTEDSRPIFEVTSNLGDLTLLACVLDNWASFELTGGVDFDTCTITNSGPITCGTTTNSKVRRSQISGYTGAANTSALIWDRAANPGTNLRDTTYTAHDTILSHAIEFGTSSPLSMTLNGITFSGYSASNNVNDSMIHIKRTTGTVTVSITNGGTTPSYRSDGATVVIVNAVGVAITALDSTDSTGIEDAKVLLEADTGGTLCARKSTTITTSGTTATATCTAHGLADGDTVNIRGANEVELKGTHVITLTDANTFTYTIVSILGASGTGTITSTAVILDGLTDTNGLIEDTGFAFGSDQPVTGFVRKGTSSPIYRTSGITGTITSDGFATNIAMVSDE